MSNDNELIAQVKSGGDNKAFAELVKRYQSAIRQFLRRLSAGDYALADDIAQDTFILAFEKIHTFKGVGSFNNWLHKLAYHRFLKVIKTGAHRFETACDESWQMLECKDAVEADILAERLMQQLDVKERLVITLNCSEGLSHSEIVEITGIPLGTVKSLILRSKQKLCKLLNSKQQVA